MLCVTYVVHKITKIFRCRSSETQLAEKQTEVMMRGPLSEMPDNDAGPPASLWSEYIHAH